VSVVEIVTLSYGSESLKTGDKIQNLGKTATPIRERERFKKYLLQTQSQLLDDLYRKSASGDIRGIMFLTWHYVHV
jgi:hypothetical protein